MAAKCALVVDDSKSARAFLSRILEKHLLDVDCVESAEEAIDYLTRHRPDVIFMDHLMPGMDGFQAVQAIKNNPRTATIPILMYTSQEGELYLGQARALGALGVLPKQIRPADVTQVLLQLHLFEERRGRPTPADAGPNDPTKVSQAISGVATPSTPLLPPELQAAAASPGVADAPPTGAAPAAASTGATGRYAFGSPVDQLLRDQIAEVRRTLVARLDELQDGLPSQLHQAVRAELPPPAPPPPAPRPEGRGWLAAAVLAGIALLFAMLWAREQGQRVAAERLAAQLTAASEELAAAQPATGPATGAATEIPEAPANGPARARLPDPPLAFSVPFGETPLAGDRVGAVRSALEELRRSGLNGEVEMQVHQGRFCLVGNAGEGYSLAPDDLAVSRCDRMGNVSYEGGASLPSLPFANMLAEQRMAAGSTLNIRMANEAPDRPVQPYPAAGSQPNAGVWNAIAAANNRIELRWRERP
jgi:CheY-like chemotaxis protein